MDKSPDNFEAKSTQAPKSASTKKRGKLQIAADILESIDDYISAFDRNWNFIYLNRTTAQSFGYAAPQDLIGKNIWTIFPNFVGTELERNYREAMEKRVVRRFEWETIYAKSGYREFTVFPSVEGITVYGVDITDRKILQRKLEDYAKNLEKLVEERTRKIRESEQSYRDLYESFGEAFITIDWELNIIHWNKAAEKMTNVAAKDALGKKLYDVMPEMKSVDITPYFEAAQKQKPARFMMNTVSRQTGKAAIFEVSTYPSTQGVIIITADKTADEENKRLLTIGQTAGMVGHDIRNPLQSMTSSMYLIKNDLDEFPQNPERMEALQEVESVFEQITYVDKIVSDLQDYTRPLDLKKVDVDLRGLVASTLSALNVPRNVETKTAFDASPPTIKADPEILKRILLNLANNALQAMPQGGRLSVYANQTKNGAVEVTVEDTGVGIPEEAKPKIFMPLFTTKSKGQGFGLAVVKRLVEVQGGTIRFESQEGRGTKFIVKLPF